jgi:hypothetical protein
VARGERVLRRTAGRPFDLDVEQRRREARGARKQRGRVRGGVVHDPIEELADDSVGERRLDLRAACAQSSEPGFGGGGAGLFDERGLADPGRPVDQQQSAIARAGVTCRAANRLKLVVALEQPVRRDTGNLTPPGDAELVDLDLPLSVGAFVDGTLARHHVARLGVARGTQVFVHVEDDQIAPGHRLATRGGGHDVQVPVAIGVDRLDVEDRAHGAGAVGGTGRAAGHPDARRGGVGLCRLARGQRMNRLLRGGLRRLVAQAAARVITARDER